MPVKAWVISEHGGLDRLQLSNKMLSEPKGKQVRLKSSYLSLNHLDLWVRKGVPGHRFPLPIIPGCDVVGTVLGYGDQCGKSWKVGQNVLVNPIVSCGECRACSEDRESECPKFGLFGESQDGAAAEEFLIDEDQLVVLDPSISPEKAACLPVAYVTAWNMMVVKARASENQTCLIQAGGSGVSLACFQIAKYLGMKIAVTTGTEEKVENLKKLGADLVINYKKTPVVNELRSWIKKLNGERGVDIAVDHIGKDTFKDSMRCLNFGGKILCCGATSGSDLTIDLKPIFFKSISIMGATVGSKAHLLELVKLLSEGKIDPIIDRSFDFKDYPKACEYLESRKAFGKVMIRF